MSLGEVAEWSNVPDSKSGVPQGTEGSNPSFSAISFNHPALKWFKLLPFLVSYTRLSIQEWLKTSLEIELLGDL